MFVVTGTPRSATGYAAVLLRALKVPCTHERIFRPRACLDEILDWYVPEKREGESSWLAWVFLSLIPGPLTVLHTVRDPWQVVDSLAHRNDILPAEASVPPEKEAFRKAIWAYCPEVREQKSAIDRAAALVINWNEKIETAAIVNGSTYLRYRVEDLDARLVCQILSTIGVHRDALEIDRALAGVPRNVNGGRQIDYNVEVRNPLVRAYLKEIVPDQEPVIGRVLSRAIVRTQREIESMMASDLADSLSGLASRYGYAPSNKGVNDESCNKCQTERLHQV